MVSLLIIKTRNAQIPTMNIRQLDVKSVFELNSMKKECSENSKAQAVNKARGQLRPESYFLAFIKSPAQIIFPFLQE